MLYKYLRADYGMQAIEHNRLKVSHPYNLNDIYDCWPKIIYDRSFDSAKNEAFEEEFIRNVHADVGLGCYCGDATKLLLWSHYGDSHKGIALGFDLPIGRPFCNLSEPSDRRIILKVDYPNSNARKVIDWQTEVAPFPEDQHLQKVMQAGFTVKGWDWKYEEEYREFVFLNECIPSGTLYFSQILQGSLREVILGAHCSLKPLFVKHLINHVHKFQPEVKLSRARPHRDSFSMIIDNALP
jgi:Protein of unknown function (DUF2971)